MLDELNLERDRADAAELDFIELRHRVNGLPTAAGQEAGEA